jgi:hypothetical protein
MPNGVYCIDTTEFRELKRCVDRTYNHHSRLFLISGSELRHNGRYRTVTYVDNHKHYLYVDDPLKVVFSRMELPHPAVPRLWSNGFHYCFRAPLGTYVLAEKIASMYKYPIGVSYCSSITTLLENTEIPPSVRLQIVEFLITIPSARIWHLSQSQTSDYAISMTGDVEELFSFFNSLPTFYHSVIAQTGPVSIIVISRPKNRYGLMNYAEEPFLF